MSAEPVTLLDAELAATACAHKLDSGDRVDLFNALQALADGRTACVERRTEDEHLQAAHKSAIESGEKNMNAYRLGYMACARAMGAVR